jgi:hypothetical protein
LEKETWLSNSAYQFLIRVGYWRSPQGLSSGNPAPCVNKCLTVIGGESEVGYLIFFSAGCTNGRAHRAASFPSSRNFKIAIAVKLLLIDAIRKTERRTYRYFFIDIGVSVITVMHQLAIYNDAVGNGRENDFFSAVALYKLSMMGKICLIFSMRSASLKTAPWELLSYIILTCVSGGLLSLHEMRIAEMAIVIRSCFINTR